MSESFGNGYSHDLISNLYNDLPPPLPLRTIPRSNAEDEKNPQFALSSPAHRLLTQIPRQIQDSMPSPPARSSNFDKFFLDLLKQSKPRNESTTLYCSCKSQPEPFKKTKKALGLDTMEIPLNYRQQNFEYSDLLYVRQKYSSYKDLIASLCDPNLPIYNRGESPSSGVCSIHRKPLQTRNQIRRAAQSMSEFSFDSEFESGNLDKVCTVTSHEFNLYLSVDTNTKGHNQWFYFAVKNAQASKTITLNIVNFTKPDSLYLRGMRPYVLSLKQQFFFNVGWRRGGYDIKYYKNNKMREIGGKLRHYYTLSFSFKFPFENDTVYFAYSEPYTYSQMLGLCEWVRSRSADKDFEVSEQPLCKSLGGLYVPMIRIRSNRKAPVVCITARVHPGETVSSFMCEGLLRFLTSDSAEAGYVRKLWDFIIIPMLNPDGVVCGNYRTSLAGVDLNRKWSNPDSMIFPTIFNSKEIVKKTNCFVDLHGHSKKNHCFMYGNYCSRREGNHWRVRVLPMLLSSLTNNFSFSGCRFLGDSFHWNCGRAVVFKELNILDSFTLESSFFGYTNKEERKEFVKKDYIEMGEKLGLGLAGLVGIAGIAEPGTGIGNSREVLNKERLDELINKFKLNLERMKRGGIKKNFLRSVIIKKIPRVDFKEFGVDRDIKAQIDTRIDREKHDKEIERIRNNIDLKMKLEGENTESKLIRKQDRYKITEEEEKTDDAERRDKHFETELIDNPDRDEKNITSGSDSDPSEDNLEEEELKELFSEVREKCRQSDTEGKFAIVKKLSVERVFVKSILSVPRTARGVRGQERMFSPNKQSSVPRPQKLASLSIIRK